MPAETKDGGSTENATVKMARLLNGQTETNGGFSTENTTVKMVLLLNVQTEAKDGVSTVKKSTLKPSWIFGYLVEPSAITMRKPEPCTLPRAMKKEQPECEMDAGGNKRWYLNDKLHREDGPAVEYRYGRKDWWLHGKRHREDGPAIEWADGDKWWYLHNKEVHPETLVDLQLSRGVFCWWNEKENKLEF